MDGVGCPLYRITTCRPYGVLLRPQSLNIFQKMRSQLQAQVSYCTCTRKLTPPVTRFGLHDRSLVTRPGHRACGHVSSSASPRVTPRSFLSIRYRHVPSCPLASGARADTSGLPLPRVPPHRELAMGRLALLRWAHAPDCRPAYIRSRPHKQQRPIRTHDEFPRIGRAPISNSAPRP